MASQIEMFSQPLQWNRRTYGVKYAGSKARLLDHICRELLSHSGDVVLDGFAGTTRVGQAIASRGRTVVSSDRSEVSRVFGNCFLIADNRQEALINDQIAFLNSLPGEDGWFTEAYGGSDENGRSVGLQGYKKPWQIHNTRKLDAVRTAIDKIAHDELNRCILLTSLILALDQVDSTMGHHVSYLDRWSARSYKKMILEVPALSHQHQKEHRIYHEDIFETLRRGRYDICYFDPPYGSNNEKMPPSRVRYDSYYHIWKTIIINDRPQLFGKAKRREDSRDAINPSPFESYRRGASGAFEAVEAIGRLLEEADAPLILLSYSSGGRATSACLKDVIASKGHLSKMIEVDYRRNVMAEMAWTGDWVRKSEEPNREFIFVIRK